MSPTPLTGSPHFIPRKEFIRDQRIISSFSLLALSGPGLVRLYSFPGPVISALRRLFDQQNLITSVREHAPKSFFEFSLDHKPWANAKSIESEWLIVAILTTVMQCGFTFLSTIDYGREQDDRVAIAFSRPVSVPSATITFTNGSATTLAQPTRAHFAISFASTTVLRVIDPPLHSTPAILQAVRGAWPRGVVSEKKVGDATYEFKLKGYKWFQEDNFPTDSLHHMLTLLTSLDAHAFSLLTSLSLATNRTRVKDLWIFSGPAEDPESPNSSPGTASLELKREITPGSGMLPLGNEKLAPVGAYRVLPSGMVHPYADAHYTHVRGPTDTAPATSSPLKPTSGSSPKASGGVLRKAYPKLPLAFAAEMDSPQIASTSSRSPIDQKQHPFASSVGSLDMTGVGSGLGRPDRSFHSITPEVLYMTSGHHSSCERHVPADTSGSYHYSSSLEMQPVETSTPPPMDGTTAASLPPADTSSHTAYSHSTPHDRSYDDGYAQMQDRDASRHDTYVLSRDPAPDAPRSPTPPLLSPGLFRDSAYASTMVRSSYEIPISWAGRDSEGASLKKHALADIREQDELEGRARVSSDRERARERRPSGPRLPSAWASTPSSAPKDERRYDDVARNMLPPTIKEHPSQEQDDFARRHDRTTGLAAEMRMVSPKHDESEGARSRSNTVPGSTQAVPNGAARPQPTRRDTDSGWVLVNIQGQTGKGRDNASSPTRDRTTAPNGAPLIANDRVPHLRSSSDSRVPRSQGAVAQKGVGVAMSNMAAAKAIVIMDAVSAKEREAEKAAQGSGLRRIFAKGREKRSDSLDGLPRGRTPESGVSKRSLETERYEKMGSNHNWRLPAAS
ncbi:hypothetical protein SCP_0112720 [Sparassis crispa]|uniref:Uncharacterized protein n=1 Tax=Sparassis crispa TaxID=139825 RepID=A0A401G8A8_9APHY|nr:hypothetical protein SCP_0112720 [Sparassis crispa]GBE78387.1 hypothetical protein SCP_0112720 [Sparassis crispa]